MSPVVPRAILFDIDGTLLHSAGAGRRALEGALSQWLRRPVSFEAHDFAGRTDLQILRRILDRLEIPRPEEETIRRILRTYLSRLPQELAQGPPGHLCPGVLPLLEDLAPDPGWVSGLLTGNIAKGAELKLRRFDLDRFFRSPHLRAGGTIPAPHGSDPEDRRPPLWGGFGDDAEDRSDLVAVALRRLEEWTGLRIPVDQTIVVGDTELDVESARKAGARTLAVASGFRSLEVLREAHPHALLEDLSDLARTREVMSRLVDGAGDERA